MHVDVDMQISVHQLDILQANERKIIFHVSRKQENCFFLYLFDVGLDK